MTQITQPGIYDLPMEVYHSQCCDGPSLSSTEARILTNKTPAHLIAERLTIRESARNPDLGTVIHSLILEPFKSASAVEIIKAPDFRTKAAQEHRDLAIKMGKTPILQKNYELAQAAAERVLSHPVLSKVMKAGEAEKCFFAKDKATGIWVKARPDFISEDGVVVDVKGVGEASDEFIQRRIFDGGWFQQAAWHAHVIERVNGLGIKDYLWAIIEMEPPHAVRVIRPAEAALIHGARLNDKALKIYAECCRKDFWPDYETDISELGLADWAYYRLEAAAERETSVNPMRAAQLARETGASPFA